jgi:hypothetical protein
MTVIYMADTLHLLGEELATAIIPKGIVKETEDKVQYLVIQEEKL